MSTCLFVLQLQPRLSLQESPFKIKTNIVFTENFIITVDALVVVVFSSRDHHCRRSLSKFMTVVFTL